MGSAAQVLLRRMAVLARWPGQWRKLDPGDAAGLAPEELAPLVARSRGVAPLLRRALRSIVRAASLCALGP